MVSYQMYLCVLDPFLACYDRISPGSPHISWRPLSLLSESTIAPVPDFSPTGGCTRPLCYHPMTSAAWFASTVWYLHLNLICMILVFTRFFGISLSRAAIRSAYYCMCAIMYINSFYFVWNRNQEASEACLAFNSTHFFGYQSAFHTYNLLGACSCIKTPLFRL